MDLLNLAMSFSLTSSTSSTGTFNNEVRKRCID